MVLPLAVGLDPIFSEGNDNTCVHRAERSSQWDNGPLGDMPGRRLKKDRAEPCVLVYARSCSGSAELPQDQHRTPWPAPQTTRPHCMGVVPSKSRERPPRRSGAPHLARFSVTLRKASCFLARFLAAASLAIFSPSRSLRPGSKI